MNKVILCGNVGSDPTLRHIDQRPLAEFTLATHEAPRTGPDGRPMQAPPEWHRLVLWDQNALFAEKYIRKGAKLLVEGRLRTRVWEDRNTIKHYVTEIYVDKLELIRPSGKE